MIKSSFLSIALFLFLSCCTGVQKKAIDINKVNTLSGAISGTNSDDCKVKIFKGIPFAAPPINDLRWKAPKAAEAWQGILPCIQSPASAMQNKPQPFFCWSKEFLIPEEPISEDCLYLNVWTPAQTGSDKLPVMVWIHGGAFTGGSGTVPLYDGEAMARKGIVFVTINYRLGIFGFLAHPELSEESNMKVSGNYGLLDQIAALKWVQENIASFGGNPERVTIAGQSAGAFSVNMLVVSPLAKGLFSGAIAESGGMFGKDLSLGRTLKAAEESGKQLIDRLGISIADLRKLPADSLLKLTGFYGITLDNVVVPPVRETFAEGKYNDVPLISGWNAGDGVSFAPPLKKEQYQATIEQQYGKQSGEFLQVFSANTDEEAFQSQKLMSSLFFGWNNYMWANLQSKIGKNEAYLYYFTRIPPGEPNYGAFHSAEFGYALHTLNHWNRPFTDTDYRLEEIMSSYWVNFAKTGNPNGEGLPEWKAFNEKTPEIIELGDEVKAAPLPYRKELYFLNELNRIAQ